MIEVAESVARPDLYWNINVAGSMAVLDAIREGNAAYEERFGHVYLVCATGRSAAIMMLIARKNPPST